MEHSVFIDSNIFIALLDESDSTHDKASKLVAELGTRAFNPVTSNFVVNETITVVSQRIGKSNAVRFADYLYFGDHNIKVITVDRDVEERALEVLKRTKSKNISFCDCTIYAIMNRYGMSALASFDKHMQKGSFKIFN